MGIRPTALRHTNTVLRKPPQHRSRMLSSHPSLRPGYSDGEDRSDGMRGETTGDNYTPEVVNAVATAISELKAGYHPRRVVLVGHSGGSAIMANLLGQQASIADAALLVSCPCDLA